MYLWGVSSCRKSSKYWDSGVTCVCVLMYMKLITAFETMY